MYRLEGMVLYVPSIPLGQIGVPVAYFRFWANGKNIGKRKLFQIFSLTKIWDEKEPDINGFAAIHPGKVIILSQGEKMVRNSSCILERNNTFLIIHEFILTNRI